MHKSKSPKTHSSIYSNSPDVISYPQLAYRPVRSQIQKASVAPKTQTDVENEPFAEQQIEATGLHIQAKYGTITPEGQERLTLLQAKMDGLLNSRLEQATRFSHNIGNIPLRRPDTPTPIQAKLTIGEPGDKYERQANETAHQVVQRIHQPQSEKLERKSLPEKDKFQMMPMVQRVADGGMVATLDLETSIQQAQGGGQPLAESIKSPMEQAFGADFSGVKVHTNTQADQLNQSIQAKAFTTGQDVFFRQGEYNPGSRGGQELLAHELTHVVQQRGGEVQPTRAIDERVPAKNDLKYEADDIDNRAVESGDKLTQTLQQSGDVNATVQRKIDNKGEKRLNDFKKMKFYTYLTLEHKSLFEAYLRRNENWALGVFLDNIEVKVDNPRQILEESTEDSSESEGEQQEDITNDDEESTEGSSESEEEQQEDTTNDDVEESIEGSSESEEEQQEDTTNDDVEESTEDSSESEEEQQEDIQRKYEQKVSNAARMVVNQITLKLNNQGHSYGSIDVTDDWKGYQKLGKDRRDYHNDIVNKVKLTYPQSANNDKPYYNWVYKNGWASNFTQKKKKSIDIQASINIHLNY